MPKANSESTNEAATAHTYVGSYETTFVQSAKSTLRVRFSVRTVVPYIRYCIYHDHYGLLAINEIVSCPVYNDAMMIGIFGP